MITLFPSFLQTETLGSFVAQKSEGSHRGDQHPTLVVLITLTLCSSLLDGCFFLACFKPVEPLNTRAVNNREQWTVLPVFTYC